MGRCRALCRWRLGTRSGFRRWPLAGEAITVVIFFDIAAANEELEKFGQRAAAPVAQRQAASDFANAFRPRNGGEISEKTGFVDFLVTRLVSWNFLRTEAAFLHCFRPCPKAALAPKRLRLHGNGTRSFYGAARKSPATFFGRQGLGEELQPLRTSLGSERRLTPQGRRRRFRPVPPPLSFDLCAGADDYCSSLWLGVACSSR